MSKHPLAGWVTARVRGAATRVALGWAALAVVLASLAGLGGPDSPFPAALLPVAGTVVLIWLAPVGRAGWAASGRWLRTPPMTWLGRVSYSLYLWHWPVAVIWLWVFGTPGPAGIVLAITLAVGLAALSYYRVERAILTTLSIVVVIGWHHDSFARESPLSLTVTKQAGWANDRLPNEPKQTPTAAADAPRLIDIGDSHASAYTAMVTAAAKDDGLSLTIASHSGCGFTLLAPVPTDGSCSATWKAIHSARPGDVALFIGLRAPRIADLGTIEPAYVSDSPANVAARAKALAQFEPIARELSARGVKVMVNDPEPLFARAPYLFVDTDHVSGWGNLAALPSFEAALDRALDRS